MAAKADAEFVTKARELAGRLKDEHEKEKRDDRLNELKMLYQAKFKDSKARNLISLFLYSGPVGQHFSLCGLATSHAVHRPEARTRFAQLHTGDGTLKGTHWTRFENFYSNGERLQKAGIVQVMHHGAAGNSEPGMARRLSPVASIFSSDPTGKYRHPAKDVLRDFWPYHPIQVDKAKGFHLIACLRRR